MGQQEIRVGFIGSGYIAGQHAEALRSLGGVRFTACLDVVESRAQDFAARFGARAAASLEETIEAADALWVCTPPKHHRQQVIACLKARRHVYCEKPLATTLEDGRAIAAAVQRSDTQAAIGFNFRFHEPWRTCKALFDAGELGEPLMFFGQRLGFGSTGGWRRDPKELCGMTIESLSHNIDLVRSLLGDVARASGHVMQDPNQPEFDISLSATLMMRSGARAALQATWASPVPATRHALVCTEGTAVVEGPDQFEFDSLRVRRKGEEGERVYRFPLPSNPLRAADAHFLAAVRGEAALEIPIRDGLRALAVSTALLTSSQQEGKAVEVEG